MSEAQTIYRLAIDMDEYWQSIAYFPTKELAQQAWDQLKPHIEADYRENEMIVEVSLYPAITDDIVESLKKDLGDHVFEEVLLGDLDLSQLNELVDYSEELAEQHPTFFRPVTRLEINALPEVRRRLIYQWLTGWDAEFRPSENTPTDAPVELRGSTPAPGQLELVSPQLSL